VRTRTAEATDAILATVRPRVGVTRVAEITHLDTLGVPCYSAIRPGCGVSAYSGKALDAREARVGAQMEALEATLAYDSRVPTRRATHDELAKDEPALDPERLPVVGSERRNLRAVELEWVRGWNLQMGHPIWLPSEAVFLSQGPKPPWYRSSNGLAAGNCLAEALAHAVAEIIERDALTIQALTTELGPLSGLLRCLARSTSAPPRAGTSPSRASYPFVTLQSLPSPLRAVIERVERAGARIDLRWIASDVAVPVFICLIHEAHAGSDLIHAGSGAHPDAAVAARRAITEAAQSRLTFIHGVREDLAQPAVTRATPPADGWFDPNAPRVDFAALRSRTLPDVVDDLRHMVDALARAHLDEVYAVDLSHPEIPFAMARVIVPGAEPPLEFEDRNRVTIGWRGRRALLALPD
jgi:ribosomal protein S12 methylthiotransferase accessory factor